MKTCEGSWVILADWDAASQAVIDAATQVFIALGECNPNFTYDSSNGNHILTIGDTSYKTFWDCTGMMRMTIRVLGYDPNWGGAPPSSGKSGAGWYLSLATGPFVKNLNGEISGDWVVLDFDPNDVRPGDIRGSNTHSHADMFIGYDSNGTARGYNSGWSDGMKKSNRCALEYQRTGIFDISKADATIPDRETAKVLRFVLGSGSNPYSSPTLSFQSSNSRVIKNLDIRIKFVNPPELVFRLRTKDGTDPLAVDSFNPSLPGYWKPYRLYKLQDGIVQPEDYSMRDMQTTDIWLGWSNVNLEKYPKPVLKFTTDGSDPIVYGRTVSLKKEGEFLINDYQKSSRIPVLFRGWSLPLNIRAVLVDADSPDKIIAQGSGLFTSRNPFSASSSNIHKISYYQELLNDTDTESKAIDTEDDHRYLLLNDSDDVFVSEDYVQLIPGLEE